MPDDKDKKPEVKVEDITPNKDAKGGVARNQNAADQNAVDQNAANRNRFDPNASNQSNSRGLD